MMPAGPSEVCSVWDQKPEGTPFMDMTRNICTQIHLQQYQTLRKGHQE